MLRFPFDEANRAVAEARGLASDLCGLRRLLGADVGSLEATPFEGLFARWLAGACVDGGVELALRADALDDQADRIESALGSARRRVEYREHDIARWEQRHRRWRDWEQPVAASRA